jgi:signal transduction histidine kinase
MHRMRWALLVVWVLGGALTVVHAFDSSGLSLRSPWSAAVLETAAACGAMLLAALSYGRWRQRRLAADLLTCCAFSELAAGNLIFAVLPLVANPDGMRPSVRLAAITAGGVTALLFLVASITPQRPLAGRWQRSSRLLVVLFVVVLAGALAIIASTAGANVGLSGLPSTEVTGDTGATSVRVLQLLPAAALALASLGFRRRAVRDDDAFYGWLAVTAALWSLARINFAFTPASLVPNLTIGDWLRLAAYAVAVVAAASEFTGYWRRLAETAVLEERRRIARDLHDGLAQELAFIATQTQALRGGVAAPGRLQMIARAADRALDESRRATAALTHPIDEPLDAALAQQAEELGGRMGVRVLLDLQSGIDVDHDKREALVRIAREAITNAGRHGRPSKITVQLANGDGIWLRISDDGRGFRVDDPQVYTGDRWGLAGMQERAVALGGRCDVTSRPYGGTKVEVWVP